MKKTILLMAGVIALIVLTGVFVKNKNIPQGATVYPAVSSPVTPTAYWEFENPNPMAQVPGYGAQNMIVEPGVNTLTYSSVGGGSGQYAIFNDVTGKYYRLGNTDTMFSSTEFGIEFNMKPDQWYHDVNILSTADNSVAIWLQADHHLTNTSAYRIQFTVKTSSGNKVINLDFDQIGPLSIESIFDGGWHHFFFKVTTPGATTKAQIWVDGIKVASANLPSGVVFGTNKYIQINNGNGQTHRNLYTKLDSLRLYNVDVPENLIWQHQLDVKAGINYQDTTGLTNIPNTPALTAPFDPEDYLPNAILPSSTNNTKSQFTDYTVTPPAVTTQLFSVPLPRYKANTILGRNVPINELTYFTMTGLNDHYSEGGAPLTYVNRAVTIASEFAKKWNYYFDLRVLENSGAQPAELKKSPGCTAPCENFMGHLLEYANLHPELPTFLGTNRAQESNVPCGNENCLNYQGFPAAAYLRNGNGQFVNKGGGVVSSPNKIWNPISTPSLYLPDGTKQIAQLTPIVAKLTNRTPGRVIDFIIDNGEVVHQYPDTVVVNGANPTQPDPQLNAGYLASPFNGVSNGIQKYLAWLLVQQETISYRNPMLSISSLNNTDYGMYAWDGWDTSTRWYWSEARKLLTPKNGQYYATTELYTRWPWNWDSVYGASNGAYYLRYAFNKQATVGDIFYSPYIAAGWNLNATVNITPGQWLGMLKNMANMGAEYFLPAYFNRISSKECSDGVDNDGDGNIDLNGKDTNGDGIIDIPPDLQCSASDDNDEGGSQYDSPDGYQATKAWQFFTPSYAQAVFSRIDTLYKNSTVMNGDIPWDPNDVGMTGIPGYSFRTGNPEDWVTVRKVNGQQKYIIAANKNQVTNMAGAVVGVAPVTIKLASVPISFDIRPQGSVYLYDITNPGTPVFYQLDAWHERIHPWRWSNDFTIEAEMYDTGTPTVKTEGPGVTTKNFSGANYDSYINPTAGTTGYTFEPRNGTGGAGTETRYLWYRIKTTSGPATATFNVDGTQSHTVNLDSPSYSWCNLDDAGNPIAFTSLNQNVAHSLNFLGNNASFHFDKFILTTDSNLGLGTCAITANQSPTVTIQNPTTSPTYTSATASLDMDGIAADSDGTVASVTWTLSNGANTASGSATGTTAWTITGIGLFPGVNTITIIATDNDGSTGTAVIDVTYAPDAIPPTVNLLYPTNAITLTGTQILSASASDASGIDHVDFYFTPSGGSPTLASGIASGSGSTYTLMWDTNTGATPNGIYTIYAVAYDNATPTSNATQSNIATVTINNSVIVPPDIDPPTVSFLSPLPTYLVHGVTNLKVDASDQGLGATGISYVKFLYKKVADPTFTVIGNSTGSLGVYQYAWSTVGKSTGDYILRAEANDGASHMTSVEIPVTVNNSILMSDLIVTDVSWSPSAPSINTPVTFKARVKNSGPIPTPNAPIEVKFEVNGTLVAISNNTTVSLAPGQEITVTANAGPSGGVWNANTPVATVNAEVDYNNTIVEASNLNNSYAETLSILVTPTVTWINPTNNTYVARGSYVTLQVAITGPIYQVQYYRGNTRTCSSSDETSNFACLWRVSLLSIPGTTSQWHAVGLDVEGNVIATSPTITVIRQ